MGESLPGFKTPVPLTFHSKRDAEVIENKCSDTIMAIHALNSKQSCLPVVLG